MGFLGKILDPGGIFNSDAGPDVSQFTGPQFSNLANFGPNPYSSPLMDSINGMPKFQPISAASISAPSSNFKEDSYKAKDMSNTALPQYDAMRARLNSQYAQTQGASQDAIDRQFAAMGGGPGNGAQLKQTENLESNIARQKGDDLMGINAEEANTRTGLQQQEAQKEFQSQEAQKGYGFQAGQADIGRQMQAGEFNAGQNMSSQQFNQQMQQQQNQFNFGANSTIAGLNTSWDQSQAEANNNEFNKILSEWQAKNTGGILGMGRSTGGFI